MNNKPNLPEEIGFGKLNLWGSWRGSLNKGGAAWMFVVYLTDIPGGWLLQHHPGWPLALRLLIALTPLAASLLYVRGIALWIRGMDELHRRIMLESCLFAVIGTLFFVTAWNRLDKTGALKGIFQPSTVSLDAVPWVARWDWHRLAYLDFSYFPLIAALLLFFFCLAHFIFNRRYK